MYHRMPGWWRNLPWWLQILISGGLPAVLLLPVWYFIWGWAGVVGGLVGCSLMMLYLLVAGWLRQRKKPIRERQRTTE